MKRCPIPATESGQQKKAIRGKSILHIAGLALSVILVLPSFDFAQDMLTAYHLSLTPYPSQLAPSETHCYMPNFFSVALDDSDLDVRDSQNRPVKSYSARSALKGLFVTTVFKMLVEDDLSAVSSVRIYLEKIATPLAEKFNKAKKWLFRSIEIAILFVFKRNVDNVNNLWITVLSSLSALILTCKIFGSYLSLTTYRLPLNTPLRC